MPRTRRRTRRDGDNPFPADWFAAMSAGQDSAFASMGVVPEARKSGVGEAEQPAMFGADVVRQAGWRRLVGLLVVLVLLFPIVFAFVVVITRIG